MSDPLVPKTKAGKMAPLSIIRAAAVPNLGSTSPLLFLPGTDDLETCSFKYFYYFE